MWPPKFSDCIEACNTASRRCERTVTVCLGEPDVNRVASVAVLARDCAGIAALAARIMERGSKYTYDIAAITAAACRECADACGKHSIEALTRCGEACRLCADECAKIAAAKK